MSQGKLIGLSAFYKDAAAYCKNKNLVVVGLERREWLEAEATKARSVGFAIKRIYSAPVLTFLTGGAGGYAFDQQAFANIAPLLDGLGFQTPKDFDFTPSAPGLVKLIEIEPRLVEQ